VTDKPALEIKPAYRSKLEEKIADQLQSAGIEFEYESFKVPYVVPSRKANYLPDFPVAGRKILIEGKGYFEKPADRQKLLFIRESNPGIDIRLVFQRAKNKIYKKKKGQKSEPPTYGEWADSHGFKWCDKGTIPDEWINEIRQATPKKRKK
jgi:hypothetical protein